MAENALLPCSIKATVEPTGAFGFTSPTLFSTTQAFHVMDKTLKQWEDSEEYKSIPYCGYNSTPFPNDKKDLQYWIKHKLSFAEARKTEGQFTSSAMYGDSINYPVQCLYTRTLAFVLFESSILGAKYLKEHTKREPGETNLWKDWARDKLGIKISLPMIHCKC